MHKRAVNAPFVHGGTKCTLDWNFADIVFSNSVENDIL